MTLPRIASLASATSQDLLRRRRFQRRAQEDLLETFDTLALELAETGEPTRPGACRSRRRAEYLRAEAAHLSALATWAGAGGEEQFEVVREALEQCRRALDASRAKLRR